MPNRLADEKSPYLRQHADNPVDWLPWGDAAFAKARSEQKPIFLSIGYSTCHWCHVMAHESFENAGIAALLNEHFVPVKVDREERPDVDKVYMSYVQALTGHGGWPLSAFLTPELKPFYGGTYFPPEDRHGRAGFPSLLRAIARGWADEREKLVAEADRVIASLQEYYGGGARSSEPGAESPAGAAPPHSALDAQLFNVAGEAFEKAYQYFYENFDAAEGGFGGAPKFPRASNLDFLFRCAALQGVASDSGREAIQMATHTLAQMARGGIHDHVGGGFHRYAVDDAWFVPHFEKMLYDQAQIAVNALDAYRFSNDERYAWLARDIFDYVLRDLTHPAGGFFSAEDADSPVPEAAGPGDAGQTAGGGTRGHAEGAFYVWTRAELERVLGDDAAFFCDHFGVTADGNVPAPLDPQGELRGKNVLKQRQSLADTAKARHLDLQSAADRLAALLERLRAVRAQRPRPHLDDKIITAWNGLMISAFARAATCPAECLADKREFYREAAVRAARFVERELQDGGRAVLYRNWRDGRGANEGFAEDYAFFIAGLLDLYEASFDAHWLEWALRLQATMDARFWDEAGGGYFNSAADDASIVLRLKEDYDGAEPSPNSVAAANLLRLAAIFEPGATATTAAAIPGESTREPVGYRARALRTIEALRRQWTRVPHAVPALLCAIERALAEPRHVVLAGDRQREDFAALAAVVQAVRPGPRLTVLAADPVLAGRAPWLAPMQPRAGRATAYVCEHYACQAPVTTPAELKGLLKPN